MTLTSTRRTLEVGRLGEALSKPGIDPSSWISLATVDDDPDAVTWDADQGWLVDVTFHGGKLDQQGPIPCRVAPWFAGSGATQSSPFQPGVEVVVAIPSGDANESPTIIGMLNNGRHTVPGEVNGLTVDEELVQSTHVLVTPHSVQQQVGSEWRTDAADKAGLHAQSVTLADAEASQAFVRGTQFGESLSAFLDGCGSMSDLLATAFATLDAASVGPLAPLKAAFGSAGNAVALWGGMSIAVPGSTVLPVPFEASTCGVLKASIDGWLSTRIKGE